MGITDEYHLGPGDKLRIEVYKDSQLSQSLQIRPDGKITLPLIGDVQADSKTPIQLRDMITSQLKTYMTNLAPERAKYYKQPFVSVARCADGGLFWANFPKPCGSADLLPEVKEAIQVIATKKTRDSNGDLILATGHNSPEEDLMMIKEAVKDGVKHVIITHPRLDVVDIRCRSTG